MKIKILSCLKLACLLAYPAILLASSSPTGIGSVATNILEPVSLISDFIHSACFILGGAFLFASLIKYIEHRRNPLMTPISTVVFLVIAGIVLILLPFLAYFAESGMKFSLLR